VLHQTQIGEIEKNPPLSLIHNIVWFIFMYLFFLCVLVFPFLTTTRHTTMLTLTAAVAALSPPESRLEGGG
jgi:Trk-type K+ transport system membrane component